MKKNRFITKHGVAIIGIIISIPTMILANIFGALGILCLWVVCGYEIMEIKLK